LSLVDAVGVAFGVAETGLAPRRASAVAATAMRDLNRGVLGMFYPVVVAGCGVVFLPERRTGRPGWPAIGRWIREPRVGFRVELDLSLIGCDATAGNGARCGLMRGWRGLEIDKTALTAGLFGRRPRW
jgi:hypothetical protein